MGMEKQLKRDYINNPLKVINKYGKKEYPIKEDVEYLYLELNYSIEELSKYFDLNHNLIRKILKDYGIIKSSSKIREKIKNTNKKKYGKESIFQTNKFKEFVKQKNLNNYGVEYHTQTSDWKNKLKKSCLKKFGVDNVFKLNSVQKKSKESCLEKYGVQYFVQSNDYKKLWNEEFNNNVIKKRFTHKKDCKWCCSKTEDLMYNMLCQKFNQVLRQYICELYPFPCDFYIPEIDTYIEYQGYWTHGTEPYIGTVEQLQKVKLWESKNKLQYKRAINSWTIKDVQKRIIAKQNGIHLLEFFTLNDFIKWYESI